MMASWHSPDLGSTEVPVSGVGSYKKGTLAGEWLVEVCIPVTGA